MSDYAADMIAESVAFPLLIDENPVEKFLAVHQSINRLASRDDVYSSFDKVAVARAIELN
jgi:hypothetical protein